MSKREMSKREETTHTSAKLMYRPVGMVSGMVAGILAGKIFDQVWSKVSPGEEHDAPGPLETERSMKEIVAAAAIQGALFAVVRTVIERGGARAFERATGEWPAD